MRNRIVSSALAAAVLSVAAAAAGQVPNQTPTQSPAPTQRPGEQAQTPPRTQGANQTVVTGCVVREAEYRKQTGDSRGGALGTGLGVSNEYVLTNASMSTGAGAAGAGNVTGSPAAERPAPRGTTGTTPGARPGEAPRPGDADRPGAAPGQGAQPQGREGAQAGQGARQPAGAAGATGGRAYSLTGTRESELEKVVGQRVEIVGSIEGGAGGAATSPARPGDQPSPGAQAGRPPDQGGQQAGAPAAGAQRVEDLPEITIASFRAVGGECR